MDERGGLATRNGRTAGALSLRDVAPDPVPGATKHGKESGLEVTVELFGVPQVLVGKEHVSVVGGTLGEIARALLTVAPALAGPVLDAATGWPNDGYIFVVNERFTRDPAESVSPASSVLLVSSVAGG